MIMTKKSVTGSSSTSKGNSSSSDEKVNKILVENFVSLQKVLTNLSVKFESLTKRLDSMIELFEESAKTVVKGEMNSIEEAKHTEKVLNKMDKLFDQNKLIARGLTLLNESNLSSSAPGDYNASPAIQSSHYAIPFRENSLPKPQNPQQNKMQQTPTPRNPLVSQRNQGFKAPNPTKMVEEEEEESDSSGLNVPKSPPFKDF